MRDDKTLDPVEDGSLVREMFDAYTGMVDYYRTKLGLNEENPDEPLPLGEAERRARGADNLGWLQERVMAVPPDQVSWWDLSQLGEQHPELVRAAWGRIKEEAHKELATGHRAAKAVECDRTPWDRARFLAVREAFIAEWRPTNGIEMILIDTLAQAQTEQQFWSGILCARATHEASLEEAQIERGGRWKPAHVGVDQAIEQAAAMVDRFNRVFMRTLRALRDFRRYASVTIGQAGQVNIGGQQVNVLADNAK